MFTLVLGIFDDEVTVTGVLTCNALSGAFLDVVVDALMVT
jgi:hypothetical protein